MWTTQTTLPRVPTGVYSHIKLATSNDIIYIGYNYGTSTRSFGIKKLYGTTLSQVGPATINSFVSTYFISSNNGDVTIFHPHDLWGGKMTVSTWNNTEWETIEAKSIAKGTSGISTIVGADKVMYTAFKDYSASGKISAMKYINGAWIYAGLPGFSSMAGDNTTLTYDANNVLHVFFVGTNQKLYAYKLVANQWEEISQNWNAGGQLKSIYAKFNSNNTLYITCHAGTNNGATDYGFAYVCTTANVLSDLPTIWSDNISSISMDLDLNGLPVVAFTDYKTTYEIYVKRYNGTSWSNASTTNVSSDGANQATVAVDNSGIIHIGFNSWVEQGYIIKKLIGNNWTTVAAQKPSTANVALPTLLFNENNELAASYSENNQIKARLLKNGVWSDLGNTNFNDVYGNKLSISFQGGNYYLAHSYLGGFAYRLILNPDVTTDFVTHTNTVDNFMYYYDRNLYAKESTQVSINTIQGCEVFNGIGSTFNLIGLKPGIYIATTGEHQCKFIVE